MLINIGAFLTKRAMLEPNHDGIVTEGRHISFKEMNERACRTANVLKSLNVKKGDRVAILAQNCVEYYDVFFGSAKIGAIINPLNWRLAAPELEYIINDAAAQTLVFGPEYTGLVESISKNLPVKNYLYVGDQNTPGFAKNLNILQSSASSGEPEWMGDDDDPLVVMYTSGTTGKPKGAILTHGNFFWASTTFHSVVHFPPGDKVLVILPLFHIAGMFTMPTFVHWGIPAYLMKGFDPKNILEIIEKEKINGFGAVPAMLQFMKFVPNWDKYDFSSVKTILVFAAPVPVPLLQEYAAANIKVQQLYGLTECCGPATVIGPDHAIPKAGSAGLPFFHTEVKVVDDAGNETPPGAIGEVIIKGKHVMKGYWNNPEATAAALKGGWLYTGDLAYKDAEGFIYIADRKKDMIISGGENIYPAEVESVIHGHPKVADVGVIGFPDEKWGEAVKAVVVVKPGETLTEQELIEWLKGKIAKFKIPKKVVFTEQLPRNPSGKILKRILREQFNKEEISK